ncbi:FAD-dependent oxidoreductase [Virgisporangium aliadipatigenens]|uniref:FAD-dependent oxidoreductase n=1 Tax=Virgisporangium aliadipatigenens TaxID=741659 RepID=A0A8J3YTL4_9ACTN|nr:FAD-dependent monooxygenase [Virgisporangium aliadipatigenens]GIJ50402.1 FAD-dependent oxidoreductase [Virgisporangium aliadipatigenens]
MDDVLIVGGGPVGLFLAGELAGAGCSVQVLEREPDPDAPSKSLPLGMRTLWDLSAEVFYRRGLLADILTASGSGEKVVLPRTLHFAGILVDPDAIDVGRLPFQLPSSAPERVVTSLAAVESVLGERAAKLGATVRRGVEVSGLEPHDDHVVVRAGADEYVARWVVGCDGGRSTVRVAAGIDFEGTDPTFTGYTTHVTMDDPQKVRFGFHLTPWGMYLRTQYEGHVGMNDFDGGAFDRSQELTLEHLQEVLRRVTGTDVTLTGVRAASTFTDRARQATTYRRGRVLLAGDAAHIHPPLGGQGLNLGIGDALNLGWKLAATIHGQAPAGLLDTYTEERHPIAAQVLDWTRAQVAIMQPGPLAQAVQGVIRELIRTPDVATYIYDRLSGLSMRYDLGSDQPLVGRNAPAFRLADGTSLAELMADGKGVILDFAGSLRDAATTWHDRVRYVSGPAEDDLGFDAVLIRPDGIVAWAGGDVPSFTEAMNRWFTAGVR